ncbi:MAG: phytanoyl-CoA dioxygenase family protein [Pirellulales bacterium]
MFEPPPNLLRDFLTDGYAVLPGFCSRNDLTELLQNVDRFIQDVVPTMPPEAVFYEDLANRATIKQLQQMGHFDPWFHEMFTASRFRELAECLMCTPVVPKNMQYFNKPPGVGQPTPPHQDGYYFMLDPCEAVTMWLALEAVDEENGCVRYVRGSHRLGMRKHQRTQTLGFSQGIPDYPTDDDLANEVAFPAQPGDLLVHDSLTIHRADGNRSSSRSRRALGFIYYSERAREDAAHEAYQHRLVEEMKSVGKI